MYMIAGCVRQPAPVDHCGCAMGCPTCTVMSNSNANTITFGGGGGSAVVVDGNGAIINGRPIIIDDSGMAIPPPQPQACPNGCAGPAPGMPSRICPDASPQALCCL